MIVNEEDAGGKICPLMTAMKSVEDRQTDGKAFCEGGLCMLWIWLHAGAEAQGNRGYCGLAGRETATYR